MKSLSTQLFALWLLGIWLPLGAQSEEQPIPTEVSEAPYEIGDLVTEQGYYIERGEDEAQINIRIVGNKLRLYWIDADGLIAEPEHQSAIIRFTGSVRGRAYHKLTLLSGGSGLGAPGVVPPPHLYNAILVFPLGKDEEAISHSFRYTPTMDTEREPTSDADS